LAIESSTPRAFISRHAAILSGLLFREVATRYGRRNIGFLWVIAEPLLFCAGVAVLWKVVKPPFEHGLSVVPFVVTGYMPIILVRHMITHALNCVKANSGLLYHRQISLLHLHLARAILEFIGVSLAFFVVVAVLCGVEAMAPPIDLSLVYEGWFLLAWMTFGLALIFGSLSELFEPVERIVSLLTYVIVPLSGTFYMAAWIPPAYRQLALTLPILHTVEMVRGGFFGNDVQTFYDPAYAAAWGLGLTVVGLVLLRFVRSRLEVE
jgi:capsular polysaccharide transport system permease protein